MLKKFIIYKMINCKCFYDLLNKNGIDFFAGVPDSLLKDFCAYVADNSENHIITHNEGGAIALTTGYHLATKKIGLVYMQNSGQGNSVNPLTSLADPDVYNIPILLLIGWRGEPGKKDEPQHVKQGKITLKLLETLNIPYEILPDSDELVERSLENASEHFEINSSPYALVVREGTFESYSLKNKIKTDYELSREEAIKSIVDELNERDIIVSTTGKVSRELFEHREKNEKNHEKDFLTVGSMGHSSQIALGIALSKPDRKVYCLDGDGAVIMHMGSLAIIGSQNPRNFKHIILNNGAHESVGGQPTAGFNIDFVKIAEACGYKTALRAETREEIKEKMKLLKSNDNLSLLEIRINKEVRSDLGRPTTIPKENKEAFMRFLE